MSGGRVLVAGIGNIFCSDDGFGSEVARRLLSGPLPAGVKVADFGIRGVHLAYELLDGYELVILIDATPRGGEPGTLYVMEVDEESVSGQIEDGDRINPHAMDPETTLRFLKVTGGWPGKVVIVACEPDTEGEMGMVLSERVSAAVDRAVDLVLDTVQDLLTDEAYAKLDE